MFRLMFLFFPVLIFSNILKVGKNEQFKTIKQAVAASKSGDSILVESGVYKEGNLSITHPLSLIGIGRPVLDGEMKYEILSFRANNILLKGFRIINSGEDEIKNIGAVRLYDSHYSTIENNIFENMIHLTVKVKESTFLQIPIVEHAKRNRAALDYMGFVEEYLQREEK